MECTGNLFANPCARVRERSPPYNGLYYLVAVFMIPNIAGAFGLMCVLQEHHPGGRICYYVHFLLGRPVGFWELTGGGSRRAPRMRPLF